MLVYLFHNNLFKRKNSSDQNTLNNTKNIELDDLLNIADIPRSTFYYHISKIDKPDK
mgnify:CR=1 FL=1